MTTIILAKRDDGKGVAEVVIDKADMEAVQERSWRVTHNGYAYNAAWILGRTVKVYMHRFLLGLRPSPGRSGQKVEVDHVNGNRLDNRRANLRLCARSLNNMNSCGRRNRSSKFRGVTWAKDKKRWQAQIGYRGKNMNLGRFDSEEEAARSYDAAATKLYGEFARRNFDG